MNRFISLISDSLERSNAKWVQQQQIQQQQQMRCQADALSVELRPHIMEILRKSTYFGRYQTMSVSFCTFDSTNNLWRIAVDAIVTADVDLSHPRVAASLSRSIRLYFTELQMQASQELVELRRMSSTLHADPLEIQSATEQFRRKYAILNHQMHCQFVECKKETRTAVARIWFAFR